MEASDARKVFLKVPHRSRRLSARLLAPLSANTAQAAPIGEQQRQLFGEEQPATSAFDPLPPVPSEV